jgi:hypothetical protein
MAVQYADGMAAVGPVEGFHYLHSSSAFSVSIVSVLKHKVTLNIEAAPLKHFLRSPMLLHNLE